MHVGILGGTGPAGRGVAVRLAESGASVTIGSRDAERAAGVAGGLVERWPGLRLDVRGADNAGAAEAEVVVVATPWDSALATVRSVRQALAGKVVVSMANALVKDGREMLALVPPRGSVAAAVQAALPGVNGGRCVPSSARLGNGGSRIGVGSGRAGVFGPRGGNLVHEWPGPAHAGVAAAQRRQLEPGGGDRGLHGRLHHDEHTSPGSFDVADRRDLGRTGGAGEGG